MLSRILSVLPDGNRRFPLRYMRMVNSILDRMSLAKNRYLLAHPIKTPGIELLKFLCLNLDINALDEYQNDADRYTEVIKFSKDTYRASVDPIFSNSIAGGKWIDRRGQIPPSEIILSCESANPLQDLPFDKDWIDWIPLRGVRFVYHNSMELPEDYAKSMLMFKEQMPSYMVVAVNIPLLLFKYYKYIVACRNEHTVIDTEYFLKEYEYSHFFDDIFDIFTLNLLLECIMTKADTDEIISRITMPIRFCTTNMLRQGIDGIKEFVDLLEQGAIKPQDFLAIHWFTGRSIPDQLNQIEHWIQLPINHRYQWLYCISRYPYLLLILSIIRRFPVTPIKDTVNLRCREIWIKYFRTAYMPGSVVNPALGDFIAELRNVYDGLMNDKEVNYPPLRKNA